MPTTLLLFFVFTIASAFISLTNGGPLDNFQYIENSNIKLGIDLSRGGAIGYLSAAANDINVVNDHDMGREIQLSFYSGPADYDPDGKCPGFNGGQWPWNPIGAGDIAGNTGNILSVTNPSPTSIEITTIPLQWACHNVPCDCIFKRRITLNGRRADVTAILLNNRTDKTYYAGRGQELPAVYSIGTLYQLWSYNGSKPFTNDSDLVHFDTAPNVPWHPGQFLATENWAALINDQGWGMGIAMFGTKTFLGGFAGTPDQGGPNDDPTGYIAPTSTEILDWNIMFEYNFSLILGYVPDIRSEAYKLQTEIASYDLNVKQAPNYVFSNNRQHFHYVNCKDTGYPISGYLNVLTEVNDPQLIGPIDIIQASDVSVIKIDALYSSNQINNVGQLFWSIYPQRGAFSAENSISFPVVLDGTRHSYSVNVSQSDKWQGTITSLRFDPVITGATGASVQIYRIDH